MAGLVPAIHAVRLNAICLFETRRSGNGAGRLAASMRGTAWIGRDKPGHDGASLRER